MSNGNPQSQEVAKRSSEPFVLIQNDCESTAEFLQSYVKTDFHLPTVVTADPVRALEVLTRTAPVLIITDLNHPRLSGEHFIQWARRICPAVPILVVTGDSVLRQRRAIEVGANAAIGLPCSVRELLATIAALLPAACKSETAKPPILK